MPLELWTGSYATLGHLRVWGQNATCTHTPTEGAQVGSKDYVGSTGRTYW